MTESEPTEGDSSETSSSLATIVTQTKFPAKMKGQVQRLVSRIILGTIGHPAHQAIRDNLDTVEGRSRINMMVAEELGRQAIADPAYMERAKARFLGEMVRKNENLEAVAVKALEIAESAEDGDTSGPGHDTRPNEDWINTFNREAEDASSDELRERLARILAGEARKPGSISRATIRAVAELEPETLRRFSEMLSFKFQDAIVRDSSWGSGDMFTASLDLEAVGLVTGSPGFTQKSVTLNDKGRAVMIGNQYGMSIIGSEGLTKSASVLLLTRLGREVSSLLPAQESLTTFRMLSNSIEKSGLKEIWIGPVVDSPTGKMVVHAIKTWSGASASAP